MINVMFAEGEKRLSVILSATNCPIAKADPQPRIIGKKFFQV
jgi:hypothetical protein